VAQWLIYIYGFTVIGSQVYEFCFVTWVGCNGDDMHIGVADNPLIARCARYAHHFFQFGGTPGIFFISRDEIDPGMIPNLMGNPCSVRATITQYSYTINLMGGHIKSL
jgi:hypothetical protein